MFSQKKLFIAVVAGIFAFAAVFSVFLLKPTVYGQKNTVSNATKRPAVSKTEAEEKPKIKQTAQTSAANAAFKPAAAENKRLKDNVQWTFGGKAQRGWFLYVALIQHGIGTDSEAETPEFAASLSVWQKTNGLAPSGILDGETLQKFVEYWQSRRVKNRAYATPEILITAPIADFYDPTREASLLQVEREAYAAFKRMVKAAAADPSLKLKSNGKGELAAEEKFLKIISAFRSREYQESLRKKSPNAGRAALAVNSPHFSGFALDIYVGGEPVITKDENRAIQVQTPVYKWMVKNAGRFGFVPYFYEPWHWEYVPENLADAKTGRR